MIDYQTPNAYWDELIRKENNLNINLFIPPNYNNNIFVYNNEWNLNNFSFFLFDIIDNKEYIITTNKIKIPPHENWILTAVYDGSEISLFNPFNELLYNLIFEYTDINSKTQTIHWKQIINIKPKLNIEIISNTCESKNYTLKLNTKGFDLPINYKILEVNNNTNKNILLSDNYLNDYFFEIEILSETIKIIVSDNINTIQEFNFYNFNNCFDFQLLPLLKNSNCIKYDFYHTSCFDCNDGLIIFNPLREGTQSIFWKKINDINDLLPLTQNYLPNNTIQLNNINNGDKKGSLKNIGQGLYKCTAISNSGISITKIIEIKSPPIKEISIIKINDILNNNDGSFKLILNNFESEPILNWNPNINYTQKSNNEYLYDNLKEGLYKLSIKDCLNYEYTKEINLEPKYPFAFNLLETSVSCNNNGIIKWSIDWNNFPVNLSISSDNPIWNTEYMLINEKNIYEFVNLPNGKFTFTFTLNNKRDEIYEIIILSPVQDEFQFYIKDESNNNDGSLKIYNSFIPKDWTYNRILNFNLMGPFSVDYSLYLDNYVYYLSFDIHTILINTPIKIQLNQNLNIDILYYNIQDKEDLINRLIQDFNNDIYNFKFINNIAYLYFNEIIIFENIIYNNNIINLIELKNVMKLNCNSINQDTNYWTNLCPGNYYLKISSNDICPLNYDKYFNIKEASKLILNYTKEDESKFNSKDGKIFPTATNGCSNYIYNLYQNENLINQSSTFFENLNNGNYILEVVDSCNNKIKSNVQILGKEPLLAKINNYTPLIDYNTCNGFIQIKLISPQNLNNSSPYNFKWNSNINYNLQSSYHDNGIHQINNLCSGIYNLTINDKWGNEYTINNIIINELPNPCLDLSNNHINLINIEFPKKLNTTDNIVNLIFNIESNDCCNSNNTTWILELFNDDFIFLNTNLSNNKYKLDNNIKNWNIQLILNTDILGQHELKLNLIACIIQSYNLIWELYNVVDNININLLTNNENELIINYTTPPLNDYEIPTNEINIKWYTDTSANELIIPYEPNTNNEIFLSKLSNEEITININDQPNTITIPIKICPKLLNTNFNETDFIITWEYPFITNDLYNFNKIQIKINNDIIDFNVIDNISPNEYKINKTENSYQIQLFSICQNNQITLENNWMWNIENQIIKICLNPTITKAERFNKNIVIEWSLNNFSDNFHQEINNWILLYKRKNIDVNWFEIPISINIFQYVLENTDLSIDYIINIKSSCNINNSILNDDIIIKNLNDDCPNPENIKINYIDDLVTIEWDLINSININQIIITTYINDDQQDQFIIDYNFENPNNTWNFPNINPNEEYKIILKTICEGCNPSCPYEFILPKKDKNCPFIENWELRNNNEISILTWEKIEFNDDEYKIDYFDILDQDNNILYSSIDYNLTTYNINKLFEKIKLVNYCHCNNKQNETEYKESIKECKPVIWLLNKINSKSVRINWYIQNDINKSEIQKIIIEWNEIDNPFINRIEIEDPNQNSYIIEINNKVNYNFNVKSLCNNEEIPQGSKELTTECNNECKLIKNWSWIRDSNKLKLTWTNEEKITKFGIELVNQQNEIQKYEFDSVLEYAEVILDILNNYKFRIYNYCDDNKSCFSSYYIISKLICENPTDFKVINYTQNSIHLEWKYNGTLTANNFILEYDNIIIDSGYIINDNTYNILIENLSNNTEYTFKLKSICNDLISNEIILNQKTLKNCDDILNVSFENVNNNLIITWNTEIKEMQIQILLDNILFHDRTIVNNSQWIFNNFINNKEYEIKFKFNNENSICELIKNYTFNSLICEPPYNIKELERGDDYIIVNWFNNNTETNIKLKDELNIIENFNTNNSNYKFCNLEMNKNYQIEFINICNEFNQSEIIYFNFII